MGLSRTSAPLQPWGLKISQSDRIAYITAHLGGRLLCAKLQCSTNEVIMISITAAPALNGHMLTAALNHTEREPRESPSWPLEDVEASFSTRCAST